jgi:hypothetical protein
MVAMLSGPGPPSLSLEAGEKGVSYWKAFGMSVQGVG